MNKMFLLNSLRGNMKQKRSGITRFTMLELLVILSIIGVLLAVLMPALRKVKDLANERSCANNLRQLSLGMEFYRGDNSGYYPNREWSGALWNGYVTDGAPYKCSEAPDKNKAGNNLYTSYGYTGVFYPAKYYFASYAIPDFRLKDTRIKSPDSKIIMTEYWDSMANYANLRDCYNALNNCRSRSVHGYRSNFLFVDSHIEFLEMPVAKPFDSIQFYPDSNSFYPTSE